MYCVRGRISYSTTIGAVCYDSTSRKFFKPIEINRTSLPSTTGMVTRGALGYPRRWCYVPCPTDRLESFWWPSMADGELRDDRQRRTLPRADVPKVTSHSFHTHSLAFVRGIGEAGDDETHSGSGSARISWCYGALPHRRGASGQVAAVGIVSPCFRRVRVERLRWESRDAGNR